MPLLVPADDPPFLGTYFPDLNMCTGAISSLQLPRPPGSFPDLLSSKHPPLVSLGLFSLPSLFYPTRVRVRRWVIHSELRGKDHNSLPPRSRPLRIRPENHLDRYCIFFFFGAKAVEFTVSTTHLAPEPIPQEQGLVVSRSLLFLR